MEKLNILWVNDNPNTAHTMVLMYATNSLLRSWWNEVEVIIWGASAKLVAEDKAVQERMKLAMDAGVKFSACLACAIQFSAVEDLKAIGVDVRPMGAELTEILKNDGKLITV